MKQDLSLLSEALGVMREKFKIVADMVNQQSIEETESPVDSSIKEEKSIADLLDDYSVAMMEVMIELIGESVEKTGVIDLYEAVTELENALQTTIRVQELAESLTNENFNH